MKEREKFFIDRIGKSVFSNKLYSTDANNDGIKIKDAGHALYLHDHEIQYKNKIKYFDTKEEVNQFNNK